MINTVPHGECTARKEEDQEWNQVKTSMCEDERKETEVTEIEVTEAKFWEM